MSSSASSPPRSVDDVVATGLEADVGDYLDVRARTNDFQAPIEVRDIQTIIWHNPLGNWETRELDVRSTYRAATRTRSLEVVEDVGAELEGYGDVLELEIVDRRDDRDDGDDDIVDRIDIPIDVDVETAIDEADHIVDVADRLSIPITDARELVEQRGRRQDVSWSIRRAPDRDDQETVSHVDDVDQGGEADA